MRYSWRLQTRPARIWLTCESREIRFPPWIQTRRFAVHSGGDLLIFIESLHASCRKPLLSKIELAPILTRLFKVSTAFDKVKTNIWTRWITFRRNDTTSYWPSSRGKVMAYTPFGYSALSCSLTDESILSVVSMSVCALGRSLMSRDFEWWAPWRHLLC